jgi:hypothetical protein
LEAVVKCDFISEKKGDEDILERNKLTSRKHLNLFPDARSVPVCLKHCRTERFVAEKTRLRLESDASLLCPPCMRIRAKRAAEVLTDFNQIAVT